MARKRGPKAPPLDCLALTVLIVPGAVTPGPYSSGCALGLDDCLALTTRVHRVRFPAGAPSPGSGSRMIGHHR
jgi:hypothetical protein